MDLEWAHFTLLVLPPPPTPCKYRTHACTPKHRPIHTCVTHPPSSKIHTQNHIHTPECFQDTKGSLICSVKAHNGPHWLVGRQPAKSTVCSSTAGIMQNPKLSSIFKIFFPNMLLPRISLLGQIIQLSVCLLLIPKLGGGSTYHLFCRLVFSQNTTIKIALAVIKMAQRQIWRQAKTWGNEGGRGRNCRGYILSSNEKVETIKQ